MCLFRKEAEFFLHSLGDFFGCPLGKAFGLVMEWIKARLSFAILQVTLLCVHGLHTNLRCLGIIDRTSLPLFTD